MRIGVFESKGVRVGKMRDHEILQFQWEGKE